MDTPKLIAVVGLLVALSAASERIVEIVKGVVPTLNTERADPRAEGWRKAALQVLAVAAGMVTTFLAKSSIPADLVPSGWAGLFALGFLASGGSGLWNAVLTYLLEVKNIKEGLAELTAKKVDMARQIENETRHARITSPVAADALAKLAVGTG
jgi:hypothetical protein